MPDRWVETTLGQVAEFHNGYPFKPAELTGRGRPVVRIKQLLDADAPADHSDTVVGIRQQIDNGDLVFSWSGTLASRIWDRGPALLNQHLFRVMERPGVLRGWLCLALDHAVNGLMEKAHGTTMKHVTKKVLEAHPVLLPPLPEQRRIVDLIGGLDAQIEAVAKAQVALLGLEAAALQAAFLGWDEDTFVGLVGRLDTYAAVIDCAHRTAPRSSEPPFGFSVGTGDLKSGDIDLTTTKPVDEATWRSWSQRAEIVMGDIILSREAPVGGVGYVSQSVPLCLGQRTVLVRVVSPDLLSSFLGAFLRSPQAQRWMLERSVGLTVAHLNVADIRALPLLGLPPIEEQERIGQAFLSLMHARRSHADELVALRLLKRSLLSALLLGDMQISETYDALLAEAV
jgi:type I restriction enzyme S subunit